MAGSGRIDGVGFLCSVRRSVQILDLFVVRDDWCFQCGGDGRALCSTCSGQGQIVQGTNTVQWGINPATGEPLTRQHPNRVSCPNCRGQRELHVEPVATGG